MQFRFESKAMALSQRAEGPAVVRRLHWAPFHSQVSLLTEAKSSVEEPPNSTATPRNESYAKPYSQRGEGPDTWRCSHMETARAGLARTQGIRLSNPSSSVGSQRWRVNVRDKFIGHLLRGV